MKKHSKKQHKSHHIFAFLGALVLIFALFFGIQYFDTEYSFQEVFTERNGQSYEDGNFTENPFTAKEDHVIDTDDWKIFGSQKFTFSYPGEYALRILNGSYVKIIPPLSNNSKEDCSKYTDEQEKSECLYPNISPDITIKVMNDIEENPFISSENIQKITLNGDIWQKKSYQDEYGGQVWYRHKIDSRIIQVSYKYADSLGGSSFDNVHASRGDQYQLSSVEQNKLVMNIITTIKIK